MEATRKQIEVTKEVRKEIKAAFKCSDMAIWRALSFALDTPLSLRIRKFARQKGGVLLLLTPAMETILAIFPPTIMPYRISIHHAALTNACIVRWLSHAAAMAHAAACMWGASALTRLSRTPPAGSE